MARRAGLRAPRLRGSPAWLATLVALAGWLILVTFGADHGAEGGRLPGLRGSFASFAVCAVSGVVEVCGGVALLIGLFVRPVAAALAVDLVGVVATA